MSLFLDFPCSLPGKTKVTAVAWCTVEPICAIVTDDHCISFYLEEGVCLDECRIQRKADSTALVWHPKLKALASGWEDGCIAVWGLTTPPSSSGVAGPTAACIFAADSKHGRAPVRIVMWNPSATRLVSGDTSGAITVWKADTRASLSVLKEYSIGSGVTCAVFTPMTIGSARAESLAHAFSPAFFIGTRSGSLYYADDMGHTTVVQALGARIDHMLFFEAKSRLVILTRALVLVQLQIGSDCKVIPVMKMKVAVAGGAAERGIKHICWAGPGVIAAATGEALIRFWNLANDETYVITLTSVGLERSSRVASVAFNPLQRYLAVGTRDGSIAMWRFCGDYRGTTSHGVAGVTTSASCRAVKLTQFRNARAGKS